MKIADAYFNNCKSIMLHNPALMRKKVRYQFFAREKGILVGANKAVNFIKDNTYGLVKVMGLIEGERFLSGEPVFIVEGLFQEDVTLETTLLGFLSYSGAATSMRGIVNAAGDIPVIDMSARHYPWQIIEETALAAYLGGASGTSTEAGYDYVQRWYDPGDKFKLYASLPHAMAAVIAKEAEMEGLYPSVMAAKLFQETFPERPITVLVDYEGKELEVAEQAFEVFGDKLFAVRLDTHGARKMQGTEYSSMASYFKFKTGYDLQELMLECQKETGQESKEKYFVGNGVNVVATFVMRDLLDRIGANHVKIVVSSGFNKNKVTAFKIAGAPMDFIGTGSWVDFMMFTADISHVFENGKWKFRTKVGRTHKLARNHKVLFERK